MYRLHTYRKFNYLFVFLFFHRKKARCKEPINLIHWSRGRFVLYGSLLSRQQKCNSILIIMMKILKNEESRVLTLDGLVHLVYKLVEPAPYGLTLGNHVLRHANLPYYQCCRSGTSAVPEFLTT
jgi:hypothetical protein